MYERVKNQNKIDVKLYRNYLNVQRDKQYATSIIQRYPLYNPANTKSVEVTVGSNKYIAYYEKDITPNMHRTGADYGQCYTPKPKTIVYVPESVFIDGVIDAFKVQVQDKLGLPPWFVNDPISKASEDEYIITPTGLKEQVLTKSEEGAWKRMKAGRELIKKWSENNNIQVVHHQDLLNDDEKFKQSMSIYGNAVPNTNGSKIEEAESNETTGAVSFNKSVITTALAVHEFVHTFFQKPNTGNMQAYEPIVEFIALQILGIQERVSPAGGVPYGTNLQGEKSTGGLPSKVSRATKHFRSNGQKTFSLADLAVRWAGFLSKGEAGKALNELSGNFNN